MSGSSSIINICYGSDIDGPPDDVYIVVAKLN